jgi:hypothetical protein
MVSGRMKCVGIISAVVVVGVIGVAGVRQNGIPNATREAIDLAMQDFNVAKIVFEA